MAEGPAQGQQRLPVLLAAVGLLCCLALTVVHLRTHLWPAASSYCTAGAAFDCAAVAASPRAIFLGLPWAFWGVFGFIALLQAARLRSVWLLPLSLVAAIVSFSLLLVSLLSVGSLCLLCELMHALAFGLLAVVLRTRRTLEREWWSRETLLGVLGFPALLALASWIAVPPYWAAFSYKGEPALPTGTTAEGAHWIGAAEPEHVIDEYTDYFCPHCKAAAAYSLRLVASHRTARLVRHQNPRRVCRFGTEACPAARAAHCAEAQGRFWQADRWLFAFAEPGSPLDLARLSKDVHLDEAQLRRCFQSTSTYDAATADFENARKARTMHTPGYRVNGQRVELPQLRGALD